MQQIGIVGLGLLGRGIATCFIAHGFRVIAFTKGGAEEFAAAREYIAVGLDEIADHMACEAGLGETWRARFVEAASLSEFGSCSFLIESVTEDLAVKRGIFGELEEVLDSDTPIASNTSALPIGTLQAGMKYPDRLLGMHWAEPAYATRFLELIRGEQTGDECLDRAAEIARRLGKDPCFVQKDVPGFIVNRLGYAMYREALHLLELGVADIDTIDRSFRNGCGLWASLCGPFRWMDITGGPALYAKAMRGVLPSLSNRTELPASLSNICQTSALGGESTFYSYDPGELDRWQQLLHKQAWAIRELQQEMLGSERNERCE